MLLIKGIGIIYFYSTFHPEGSWSALGIRLFLCSLPPPFLPLFHCTYINILTHTYILIKSSSSFTAYVSFAERRDLDSYLKSGTAQQLPSYRWDCSVAHDSRGITLLRKAPCCLAQKQVPLYTHAAWLLHKSEVLHKKWNDNILSLKMCTVAS